MGMLKNRTEGGNHSHNDSFANKEIGITMKERKTIDGVEKLGKCFRCGATVTTIELSKEIIPLKIQCDSCGQEYVRVFKGYFEDSCLLTQ